MAKKLSIADVLLKLKARIAASSLRKVAAEIQVSPAYLSDVMRGRRDISHNLASKLRLRRTQVVVKTVTFEAMRPEKAAK
jgi:hypothetical protein